MKKLVVTLLTLAVLVCIASPVFAITVGAPTNFKSYPKAESVGLTWTKGSSANTTLIRYAEDTYPTTVTEGTQTYNGTLSSYSHTGLDSGHTYYYSAWGRTGGDDSAAYATVMATTTAGTGAGDEPDAPSMPSTWFQTPDYTAFTALPFYDILNAFLDSYEMPRASGWFFTAIFGCIIFAILVFALSRHPMPPMIALAVALAVVSLVKLVPMFMMAFAVIFALGAFQLRGAR